MKKQELEMYVEETLKFDNIDEAFDDYVYDMNEGDIIALLTDDMKREILSLSPSYVKKNEKYYFNGEFQDLTNEEIKQIINKKESEVD